MLKFYDLFFRVKYLSMFLDLGTDVFLEIFQNFLNFDFLKTRLFFQNLIILIDQNLNFFFVKVEDFY